VINCAYGCQKENHEEAEKSEKDFEQEIEEDHEAGKKEASQEENPPEKGEAKGHPQKGNRQESKDFQETASHKNPRPGHTGIFGRRASIARHHSIGRFAGIVER
jgi:hypothetical protein